MPLVLNPNANMYRVVNSSSVCEIWKFGRYFLEIRYIIFITVCHERKVRFQKQRVVNAEHTQTDTLILCVSVLPSVTRAHEMRMDICAMTVMQTICGMP